MKKILFILFTLIFLFSLNFSSNVVFASVDIPTTTSDSEMSSFELFWPIVAGRVRGDSLYSLKLFKEKVRGFFIFSSIKKAEYFSFISTKRLVEMEELMVVRNDFDNALATSKDVLKAHQNIMLYIEQTKKDGLNAIETSRVIVDTVERQISLLNFITPKLDEQEKVMIDKISVSLNSLLEELSITSN